MTFATIAARTPTNDASVSVHTIGLGTPSAGDLLIVAAAQNIPGYIRARPSSGKRWFRVANGASATTPVELSIYAKIAEGGDTLVLETGNAGSMAALCYRLTGHGSSVAVSASATGTSTNGNTAAASISGAAQDVVYIPFLATRLVAATAAPASYGTLTTASASSLIHLNAADRNVNGTSEDPGAFTNTSAEWIGFTIAVPEIAIATNARASQAVREIVSNTTPAMRGSHIVREVISANALQMMASHVVVETISTNVPDDVPGGPNKYRQIQVAC